MPRTTPTQVAGIIEVDPSINLDAFIGVANSLVTELCKLTDTARLEMIERYLAAHLYALRDQLPASESVGGASANYQGKTGMFLSATTYGQTAALLDTSGGLSPLLTQPRHPKVFWVGTKPCR